MNIEHLKTQPQRFLNRELSWLAFNRRVLEEANNLGHPLFERVRFLSICADNLDEFYMVRVAGLKTQVRHGITKRSHDGLTPLQQLSAIREETTALVNDLQSTWRDLVVELTEHEIDITSISDLSPSDERWLSGHFEREILPVLTPIALDPAHPFPFIPNEGLSIILQLSDKKTEEDRNVLIQIPSSLNRFIQIPGTHARHMLIEKVIIKNIAKIFSPSTKINSYATFRIIRDSEMIISDQADDLVQTFESAIKKRRRGDVVHLSVHHNIDRALLNYLVSELKIMPHQALPVHGLVGLNDCQEIIDNSHEELTFTPYDPRFPERIREFSGDCFAAISQKDIIVHHPYESFDVVVQFLMQAARDPGVVSIKQTLYRTSKDSPIVSALIEAAENGKTVTAMVELKARFDEEANIRWARDMERAGVQVVYGVPHLKTHAKVSLVVRRESGHLKTYTHFGTGNYHPINARIYTDLSYFTCNPALCRDTAQLFNYMTGYAIPQNLEKLAISPFNLRDTLSELIDIEIANVRDGKPGQIWMKCNALLDTEIIDKLYEASEAGVEIDLVVRGICTLRPGIPGLSENIRVKSLVGRFLEHSRVYCFGNGHVLPSRKARVFMSSADIMNRNLDGRIEALIPIENKTVHKQILDQIMVANLKDQRQSWIMDNGGIYTRMKSKPDAFSAHEYFMNNPSLSGRGKSLKAAPMPPRLSLIKAKTRKKDSQTNASE